jgi:GT2 family glycosyltransferase
VLHHRLSVLAPRDEGMIIDLAVALLDAKRPREALAVLQPRRGALTVSDARFLVMAQSCAAAGTAMPVGVRARYHDWIETVERAGRSTESIPLIDAPVISVIMPVCDPPVALLAQAIASVREQDYPSWQLCIADDASCDPEVRVMLESVALDPRIVVAYREDRGHISVASNTALSIATGDVVCFLDHDDRLAPGALGAVAEAFAGDPELVMVYSDEDKINADGARFDPHFKPDWNPDLLLSQNYVCHLMAIRRSRVVEVGGLRIGLEGSQDHDLTLRVTKGLKTGQVRHIPRILYHWRVMPGSTSLSVEAKPYAAEATRRALQDHHDRTGTGARVQTTGTGWVTRWPLPEPAPRVSIIIPTRDRLGLLRRCVESLRRVTDYPEFEIIIVDNDSVLAETSAYFRSLEAAGEARVMKVPGIFNFSRLNNTAVVAARGDVLCLLNNDIEVVEAGWLREMVSQAVRPGVGIVGAKLLYGDETIQHGGVLLWGAYGARHMHVGLARDTAGRYGRAASLQILSAVTGACMVMRREIYEAIDGLDEAFAVNFGDIDLCLRANAAGYRTIWTPHAVLLHHESASRGTFVTKRKAELHAREQSLMRERWGTLLSHDPAYNPNLSLDPLDKPFDLAASRRELA